MKKLIRSARFHLIIAICAFLLGFSAFVGSFQINTSNDIENAYAKVFGIYVDGTGQLYLKTDIGILRYRDGKYLGRLTATASSDIISATESDVTVCDNKAGKTYVHDLHGTLISSRDDTAPAYSSTYFTKTQYKNGTVIQLTEKGGRYNVTDQNGSELYHTPEKGYRRMVVGKVVMWTGIALVLFGFVNWAIHVFLTYPKAEKIKKEIYRELFGALFRK